MNRRTQTRQSLLKEQDRKAKAQAKRQRKLARRKDKKRDTE